MIFKGHRQSRTLVVISRKQPGVKVDGRYYREVLLKKQVLPESCVALPVTRTCFSRTAHAPEQRARETIQLLQQETPQFISPDLWTPNSPDLNPVDYRIWGWMQERVYKTPVHDTNELKQRLIRTWASIPQSVVKEAIEQWRIRLHACGQARGRRFEHLQ